jgi:hypothetical protein
MGAKVSVPKPEEGCAGQAPTYDVDIPFTYSPDPRGRPFNLISGQILSELLDGKIQAPWIKKIVIIDCRGDIEFNAGHIKYGEAEAIHCHPAEGDVAGCYDRLYDEGTVFVFHCAQSFARGPECLRRWYEKQAAAGRPKEKLHAFVLRGGYNEFHEPFAAFCCGEFISEFEARRQAVYGITPVAEA